MIAFLNMENNESEKLQIGVGHNNGNDYYPLGEMK